MGPTTSGAARTWRVGGRQLTLDAPIIAGVLNVTPDSFSDGGKYASPGAAIARGHEMIEEGAGIIDVGAESTRPGAHPVSAADEWNRLAPVLAGLSGVSVPVSIDTMKSEVAERAIDQGASVINDVSALSHDLRMAGLAARSGAGLVLMHMRGTPRTMQLDTHYDDIVADVRASLLAARDRALEAGCAPEQIAIDPGLGFGKSVEGNLEVIARLGEIVGLGSVVWIGPSRKSFLGAGLEAGPDGRLAGTVATCQAAVDRGVHVVRVHDVREVHEALSGGSGPGEVALAPPRTRPWSSRANEMVEAGR